jgi:hypothetical protein
MTLQTIPFQSHIPQLITNKRKIKLIQSKHKLIRTLLKKFHRGAATVRLLCFKDKIVIPTSLTKQIVQWYHYLLCHPSINRTEETIGQHFYRPKMRDQVTNDVLTCAICQTQKKQSKKYGLLPEKEAEAMPWYRLCVNLIGQYYIKSNVKGVKILPLKCITMIDPATG